MICIYSRVQDRMSSCTWKVRLSRRLRVSTHTIQYNFFFFFSTIIIRVLYINNNIITKNLRSVTRTVWRRRPRRYVQLLSLSVPPPTITAILCSIDRTGGGNNFFYKKYNLNLTKIVYIIHD